MRTFYFLLFSLTITSLAHAQQQAVDLPGIRQNPFMILRMEVVQKDLKLSDDQVKQVREGAQKYAEIDRKSREQRGEGLPPGPDFDRQVKQSWSERDQAAAKILNEAQAKRFKQIERQLLGPRGFINPDLAAELGLAEEQRQAMREIFVKFNNRRGELTRGVRRYRSGDEVHKKIVALDKERDQELLKQLTPAQAKKWDELEGPRLPISR